MDTNKTIENMGGKTVKYTVSYTRKVKAGDSYEMLEIGLTREFDENMPITKGFEATQNRVNNWIDQERRMLNHETET